MAKLFIPIASLLVMLGGGAEQTADARPTGNKPSAQRGTGKASPRAKGQPSTKASRSGQRPRRMQALFFRRPGGPEVLESGTLPVPRPRAGEVLVEVRAAALNRMDVKIRAWEGLNPKGPVVGGADAVGVISEVGPGVKGFRPGTWVVLNPALNAKADGFTRRGQHSMSPHSSILGEDRQGTFAEYVVVPAGNVLRMPRGADVIQTAGAPLVFGTATRMLDRSRLRSGETILVVGASGGVNSITTQMAKLRGARVIATVRSRRDVRRARELGADHVVLSQGDWSKKVMRLTRNQGVDVVIDNVGAATWAHSIASMKNGGRVVTIGATAGNEVTMDVQEQIADKQIEVIGSRMFGPREFERALRLLWSGKVSTAVDRVVPLSQGAEAQAAMERGGHFGKIILVPDRHFRPDMTDQRAGSSARKRSDSP